MILSTVSLASLVYAVIELPPAGWSSGKVLGGIVLALGTGLAFLAHERWVREPMLDLGLFRNPRLGWGTAAMTLAALALAGLAFNLSQFLQFVQGYTPLQAGLRFLPIAAGFGVAGPLSQKLVGKLGTGRTVAGGLGLAALTMVAIGQVDPGTTYWLLGSVLLIFGLGIGIAFVPSTDAVMAAVPVENAGLGSAINDAARQVGAALGIGVLGAIVNAAYASKVGDAFSHLAPEAAVLAKRSVGAALQVANAAGGEQGEALRRSAMGAFTDGFTLALLVGAALSAVGAAVVFRRLPSRDVIRGAVSGSEGGRQTATRGR
jgi:predicted MFS family arabinose efflux permease